ncbi:MAG: ABC transporter substrate-binding protein [Lachnospiraceae bacterium]|nr:ABC transporter substrate-binding protein [Lachnospiraceae bacterium]
MKKRVMSLLLIAVMAVTMLAGCGGKKAHEPEWSDEGKVLNIYAWNEEFKGFFEKYYASKIPSNVKVNWIINASDNGLYQQKLDEALSNQWSASADNKVDLFLAEADYIIKYADSDTTLDVTKIGVTDFSNMYDYTLKAASDADGVVKGVSFQCCPSALIYRRSIAKDVLGTDDPAKVQEALNSWTKFEDVAKQAKDKGYYMTASFAETYRVFSNNCTSAWVTEKGVLNIDKQIEAWIAQTDKFIANKYTLTAGVWDTEKTDQMFKTGKTMCFFGPAWYFNFCMTNAQDEVNGCPGDWAICQGPQAHFWGGTWILAANGTDNASLVADIMNAFTNDTDTVTNLVAKEGQYPNNKAIAKKFANDATYKNEFLGGQNDIAVFADMTDSIKWQYHTEYDQLLNEGLQSKLQEFYKGAVTKDKAMENYYNYVKETYPSIKIKK